MAASDDMLAFVDQLYDSFSSGDSTVWTSRTAGDIIGIGSDPEEWWEGRSAVADIVTAQVHEMSKGRTRLVAGDPRIFEHGDVFWSVDRPMLQLGDGTEVPMRVTFIAVAEEGTLQLQHFHYSVGAGNEDVFRQRLTTEEPSGLD